MVRTKNIGSPIDLCGSIANQHEDLAGASISLIFSTQADRRCRSEGPLVAEFPEGPEELAEEQRAVANPAGGLHLLRLRIGLER